MADNLLQRELKKRKPFDVIEQEAWLGMVRTCDQLEIHFARLFRQYRLTPQQYNILRILRGEGSPLPILEIAARMITIVPGITGLVDRLEQAELAKRRRCEEDRRVVYVEITPKGVELLATLDQPVVELHKQMLAGLSKAEIKELIRLSEKIRVTVAAMDLKEEK
ncbi:transcriptional regulator, MarR family [Pirellula staleyi DSM 6068]|uniref:Transcriptional regulator, MarR family n=1 Tax=Pirellula staleyi (strain ATCC 27377 / DSM 6068 / ICPB 4128) TaxID=530564 RepID=D2QY77_PIRSD|nr:MarR family transcriptional regulator [Pirellula staleyi]ADB16291.1 transcriptional regulator, MarR family [Pirellula staleyi DSM 6068]